MTLYDRYKKLKLQGGGPIQTPGVETIGSAIMGDPSSLIQTVGQMGAGIVDAADKPDPFSGAQSDLGAAIKGNFQGGTLGMIAGFLNNRKQRKEGMRQFNENIRTNNAADASRSAAALATNPSLLEGYKQSGYFAMGGLVEPGDPDPNDPKFKIRTLKPEEMSQWNQYLDFVKSKGYEGSAELNVRNKKMGENLFNEFKKANPNVTIGYDIVPSVQAEMVKLRDQAQSFARRRNDPNADKIMSNISAVDGWFGSQTSQFRFPSMTYQEYNNGQLVRNEDQGLVNGNMQTVGATYNAPPAAAPAQPAPGTMNQYGKPVPPGATIERMQDGYYYQDPQNGEWVKVKMENGGPVGASLHKMYMSGGYAKPLASDSSELIGNSHA
ncbi:MAG TPA: hypothetical protein V6C65_41075, partial [Allocoleopsis sp.]